MIDAAGGETGILSSVNAKIQEICRELDVYFTGIDKRAKLLIQLEEAMAQRNKIIDTQRSPNKTHESQ